MTFMFIQSNKYAYIRVIMDISSALQVANHVVGGAPPFAICDSRSRLQSHGAVRLQGEIGLRQVKFMSLNKATVRRDCQSSIFFNSRMSSSRASSPVIS